MVGVCERQLRPYYAEGSKSMAYEIAEQLGWRLPDHTIVPMASGSLLTKIHKGYRLSGIHEARTRRAARHTYSWRASHRLFTDLHRAEGWT
ncbi:MAG: hypothetical protein WDM80_07740 [Limisphaerales bacterium]